MSLLALDANAADIRCFAEQADAKHIPLTILPANERPELRAIYGARLLLLRPDLHVAWRGDSVASAADAARILDITTGS